MNRHEPESGGSLGSKGAPTGLGLPCPWLASSWTLFTTAAEDRDDSARQQEAQRAKAVKRDGKGILKDGKEDWGRERGKGAETEGEERGGRDGEEREGREGEVLVRVIEVRL